MQIYVIQGSNGTGKTWLLRAIAKCIEELLGEPLNPSEIIIKDGVDDFTYTRAVSRKIKVAIIATIESAPLNLNPDEVNMIVEWTKADRAYFDMMVEMLAKKAVRILQPFVAD